MYGYGWTWKDGTPQERADAIRSHARDVNRPLSPRDLRRLFLLTEAGLQSILSGGVWRPEYEDLDQRKDRR
jgi:hypothetical protein